MKSHMATCYTTGSMLPSLVMFNSFSLLHLTKMAALLSQCSMVVSYCGVVCVILCLTCFTFLSSLNEMTSNLDQCTMQGRKRSVFHNNWVGRLTRHNEIHPCLASGWCWFPTRVACHAYLSPLKETTSNPGQCPMSVLVMETWPCFITVNSQSKHAWEASDDDYDHINLGLVATSSKEIQIVINLSGVKKV